MVLVVDDDPSIRAALQRLLQSVGLRSKAFASASDFLQRELPDAPCCLVLDVRMPGQSGLDFQAELAKANIRIPIVFMTGHGDIPMTVKAMKAGAVEFLPKPFREEDMLDATRTGLERDRTRREADRAHADVAAKVAGLTERERQVMALVASGLMNKQIAARMQLAQITVKVYRASMMRKVGAKSVADVVRIADATGIRAGSRANYIKI
jgi:FixJ family two-component response regulator